MTVTATYLDDLGRVRIAFTGIAATVDYATVERSIDGVRWHQVRGAETVPVVGGAGHADDYEYMPGVANRYRVRFVDSAPISYVGTGTAAHADNAAITPGLPDGLAAGDLLVLAVGTTRGAVPDTPPGWTLIADMQPLWVFQRYHDPAAAAPTVTWTGGVAGDSMSAVISAWHNGAQGNTPMNGIVNQTAAQDITTPPLTIPADGQAVFLVSWKASNADVAVPPYEFELRALASTTGQSITVSSIPAELNVREVAYGGPIAVTGGIAAPSCAVIWSTGSRPTQSEETVTVTPTASGYWIKNVRRPNLNRKTTVIGVGDISRPSRAGVFDVAGRGDPIAVTEVQGSRRTSLTVRCATVGEADTLDRTLATGDVLLFQGDGPECPVPTMYGVTGVVRQYRPSQRPDSTVRYVEIPVTEVAAPDLSVFVGTVTWADIVNQFATWADLIAAEPTWSDVLTIVAESDVITG
ncbi:hypothetical protein [Saccharomonospora cyanea]|uniref:Uncharacterized protein n=1 Tax=Saccharomonospora cyanea NA-134 TaxID=882082 RepID=H5XG46_9PSEU|nr:hypothetical protein [Saccharomonospora cyanea]EHR62628.1 hypothetical protein SaccyDRAFT_3801 [Saccharomonospora cyanea NA-134]